MKRSVLASCFILVLLTTILMPVGAFALTHYSYEFLLSHDDLGGFKHSRAHKEVGGNWGVQINRADQHSVGRGLYVNVYQHTGARDTKVMGNGFWIRDKNPQHFNTWKITPNMEDPYCLFGRLEQNVSGPDTEIGGIWSPQKWW